MLYIKHEEEASPNWRYNGQWSYPLSELPYLLEQYDGRTFILHKHRLYETEEYA